MDIHHVVGSSKQHLTTNITQAKLQSSIVRPSKNARSPRYAHEPPLRIASMHLVECLTRVPLVPFWESNVEFP